MGWPKHQPGMVTHDFPVRPDQMISIQLPVDLTPEDAERVAEFVRSLAFKPALGIQEGSGNE